MSEALVIFEDDSGHPLSTLLKPGFRHVFCAVRDGDWWAVIEGVNGHVEVSVTGIDDLAGWYREHGFTVVETGAQGAITMPLALTTCVGMVKAVLGIRSWALTPWQLYRHLTRRP